MTYNAIVARLTNVREHPNADRLALATVLGSQIVVGLDAKDGDLGIYFPTDGKISEEYGIQNDLFPRFDDEGKKIGGGMFDPKNRRVRAQNLRSVKSDGYFASLESVAYTGINLDDLYEGFSFNTLNDHLICEKYFTPQTLRAMKGGTKATRKTNIMFPKHVDTEQFAYKAEDVIVPNSILYITEKLHGTCLTRNAPITMADGSKRRIADISVGDKVLGLNENSGEVVEASVTDVMVYPGTGEWIDVRVSRDGRNGNPFTTIRCTPDHRIWTTNGYKEAANLTSSDLVLSIQYALMPSSDQRQILLGKMLGDGTLSSNSTWAAGLVYGHVDKDIKYLEYTYRSLGNLGGSGKKRSRVSGYGSQMYDLTTRYSYFVKEYLGDFVKSGVKHVPTWVADALGPIGLAFWYMDDGNLAHSEKQKDRANFATCGFNYEDCVVLKNALARNGITNVTIYNTDGYWRIRINAGGEEGAMQFFKLIAPYVPPSMQYKLPATLRDLNWSEPIFEDATMVPFAREQRVLELLTPTGKAAQGRRYDITTTTHNFVANDTVVHNSQRMAHVLEEKEAKKRWYHKLLRKELPPVKEWQTVVGTRNVVLENRDTSRGYYDSETFRFNIADSILPNLRKNEVIYGEVTGYASETTPVMGEVSTKDLKKDKEFKDIFNGNVPEKMIYRYGSLPGECSFWCYRIAHVDEEGKVIELSWPQVKARCNELGIAYVPELIEEPILIRGGDHYESDMMNLRQMVAALEGGISTIDGSHIREGVCVRVERPDGTTVPLKQKNYYFKVLEGIIKAKDDYVDLEEAA